MKKSLVATAYHEAGHALADYVFGFRIRRVSIVADDSSLGRVQNWRKSLSSREFIECRSPIFCDRTVSSKVARWHDEVVSLLAGGEAQRLVASNSRVRFSMTRDLDAASDILYRLHPQNELPLVFKWLQLRAKNIVTNPIHRGMIKDLASILVKSREMTGQRAVATLRASCDRQTLARSSKRPLN